MERLDDLHPLLLADREIRDPGVEVEGDAVARAQFSDTAACGCELQAKAAAGAHRDVLQHREARHEHKMLVDHADAGANGIARRPQDARHTIDRYAPRIRLVEAVKAG